MRKLEQHFNTMYDKFKLMLYDRALKERGRSMPGDLSLQEVIYMEIIIALGDPTVAEFSRYAKLSAPNTAYRLNKLEERGYIRHREEYGVIFDYIHLVCERIEERFEPGDVDKFEEMLGIISEELMPEAGRQLRERD